MVGPAQRARPEDSPKATQWVSVFWFRAPSATLDPTAESLDPLGNYLHPTQDSWLSLGTIWGSQGKHEGHKGLLWGLCSPAGRRGKAGRWLC